MAEKKVSVLKAFKTIIWPRRNLVFIGLLLIVISKAASFVAPISLRYFLDDIVPNKNYDLLKILVAVVILSFLVQHNWDSNNFHAGQHNMLLPHYAIVLYTLETHSMP